MLARVKWMPLVFIKHITELITGNKSYYRGGRYRQVSLYNDNNVNTEINKHND